MPHDASPFRLTSSRSRNRDARSALRGLVAGCYRCVTNCIGSTSRRSIGRRVVSSPMNCSARAMSFFAGASNSCCQNLSLAPFSASCDVSRRQRDGDADHCQHRSTGLYHRRSRWDRFARAVARSGPLPPGTMDFAVTSGGSALNEPGSAIGNEDRGQPPDLHQLCGRRPRTRSPRSGKGDRNCTASGFV